VKNVLPSLDQSNAPVHPQTPSTIIWHHADGGPPLDPSIAKIWHSPAKAASEKMTLRRRHHAGGLDARVSMMSVGFAGHGAWAKSHHPTWRTADKMREEAKARCHAGQGQQQDNFSVKRYSPNTLSTGDTRTASRN